jgi:hypothetical protein
MVVGTYIAQSAAHGFLFDGANYQTLDFPAGPNTTNLYDINDFGQIVGTYQTPNGLGPHHVFLANMDPVPEPMTPLTDGDASSAEAQYTLHHDNSVALTYDATDVGAQQGTIKLSATWGKGDFASRSIDFNQVELPQAGFGEDQGARFQLILNLGNYTGKPWERFTIHLEDPSVPTGTPPNQAEHSAAAHFHPDSAPDEPIITGTTGFTALSELDNAQALVVSGGKHHSGKYFGVMNFYVHERNLMDGAGAQAISREFRLVLTPVPVPEPAAPLLFAIAAAILLPSFRSFTLPRTATAVV